MLSRQARTIGTAEPSPTIFSGRMLPVSVKELIRRIDAALPEWKQFKFTRNDPIARQLFGDYYIVDLRTHVATLGKDVEQFARDLGVLKPWETVRW